MKLPRILNVYKSSIYHIKRLRVLNELKHLRQDQEPSKLSIRVTMAATTPVAITPLVLLLFLTLTMVPSVDYSPTEKRSPLSPFSVTILPAGVGVGGRGRASNYREPLPQAGPRLELANRPLGLNREVQGEACDPSGATQAPLGRGDGGVL